MDHEPDIDVTFHDPDPVANTQTVTLRVPARIDPDAVRKLFLSALWGQVDDKIERES